MNGIFLVYQYLPGQATTLSRMTDWEACYQQLNILNFIGYNVAQCVGL